MEPSHILKFVSEGSSDFPEAVCGGGGALLHGAAIIKVVPSIDEDQAIG